MHTNSILLFVTLCLSATIRALSVPYTAARDIPSFERRSQPSLASRLSHIVERKSIIEALPNLLSKRAPILKGDDTSYVSEQLEKRIIRNKGDSKRSGDLDQDSIERSYSGDLEKRIVRNNGGSKRSEELEKRIIRNNGGTKRSDDIEKRIVRNKGGSKRSDAVEKRVIRNKGGSKRSEAIEGRIVRDGGGSKRSEDLERRIIRNKGGS